MNEMQSRRLNLRSFITVVSLYVLFFNPNSLWAITGSESESPMKDATQQEPAVLPQILPTTDTIPGPGDFLDNILHSLNKQSDESESTFEQLQAGIPHVLPDLYKVYVTL